MSSISKIEVSFAIPVELTQDEMQIIDTIANDAARRTETDKIVHWAAGCGSKPNWSKTDCAVFGYTPTADSPESGEPTWNDEVFYIETCARERYDSEPFEQKRRLSHAEKFRGRDKLHKRVEEALTELDAYADITDSSGRPNLAMRIMMILKGEYPNG